MLAGPFQSLPLRYRMDNHSINKNGSSSNDSNEDAQLYTQTDTHAHTQTDTHSHTQTDRHSHTLAALAP